MKNLLIFLFLFCVGGVINGAPPGGGPEMKREDFLAFLKDSAADCIEKYNAGKPFSDADIEGFTKVDKETTKNVKCLRACLMKKFELIGPDGKLAGNKFAEMVQASDSTKVPMVKEIIVACNTKVTESEECEKAHLYSVCVYEEMNSKGIKYPK